MKYLKNEVTLILFLFANSMIYSQKSTSDSWLLSKLQGSSIGYIYFNTTFTDQHAISVNENNVVLNRLNNKVEIYIKTTVKERKNGGIDEIDYDVKISNQKTHSKIVRKGQVLHFITTIKGKEYKKEVPFIGNLVGPEELRKLTLSSLKSKDDEISFQTYFPDYGKIYTATRKVQKVNEGKIHFTEEIKGLPKVNYIINSIGKIVSQKYHSPFGTVESSESTKELCLKALTETVILPNEIFDQTMARNNVRFLNPRSIKEITIKITAKDPKIGIPNLEGDNQKVIEKTNEYVILKITQPDLSKDVNIADRTSISKEFLKSNSIINSNDARIVEVANQVNSNNAYKNLVSLRNWVTDNMSLDLGIVIAPASEIIENKKGTCTEYATILTSLYRAKNIPSRMAMGFVYMGGVWAGHAWSEAYLDNKWVPFDAALPGKGIADAARFRFVSTSLKDGSGDLIGEGGQKMYGNVRIETLSYKDDKNSYQVKDNKPYSIHKNSYVNKGLGIRVEKSNDFSFKDMDKVWPKTTILVVANNDEKMEIHQKSIKPDETVDEVVRRKLKKLTGSKIKKSKGLYISRSKDGATLVKVKPLSNGYLMAKYSSKNMKKFLKKTKVVF